MEWIKIKQEHISSLYTNYEVGLLVRFQLLVAFYKRIPLEEEMKGVIPLKRLSNFEQKLKKLHQIDLKTVASRVLEDVESIEIKKENNKERQRRFREKKDMSRVSNALRNAPDKRREEEIRISETTSPSKKKL